MSAHEMPVSTTIMIIPASSGIEMTSDEMTEQYEDETDYVSPPSSGLTPVAKCCLKKQCFNKFAPQVQEDCFNRSVRRSSSLDDYDLKFCSLHIDSGQSKAKRIRTTS